jgi:hypothetical protein
MLISADLKCYSCGSIAGELLANTTPKPRVLAFLPAAPGATKAAARQCNRCGGSVYMDEAQTISRHEAQAHVRRWQHSQPAQRAVVGA